MNVRVEPWSLYVDVLVNVQPELEEVRVHLLVVNVPLLLMGMVLPVNVKVLEVALKMPELVREHGLPDIVKVALEVVNVPELIKDEL